MKLIYRLVFLFMLTNVYCAAQETVKVEEELEALRKKLMKEIPEPESGSALVYEVSRSKDDAKFIGEIFKSKNRDQTLMRLYMKGDEKKTFFYLDLRNNDSHMLMLSEARESGFELRGVGKVMDILAPFLAIARNENLDKEIKHYPQVDFSIESSRISSGVGLTTLKKLPWEVLDEDISGIEEAKDHYKISRKKHGGYFTIDKKSGLLLEQKETLDGQTRTMRLISQKAWDGKIDKMFPNYTEYKIETKVLGVEAINKLTDNMFTETMESILKDKELAAKIKDNPKEVERKLRGGYLGMWRKNSKLLDTPDAWKAMKMEFIKAVEKWTDEGRKAWNKKAKSQAVKELRTAFFPRQNATRMKKLFESAVKGIELDEAEKVRK